MWQWVRRRFGISAVARGELQLGLLGESSVPQWRKGKSMIADAIAATGAEDGDTVAIDRDGQARVIGRTPRVVVDNTK